MEVYSLVMTYTNISPEYFFDEMSWFEVDAIMEKYNQDYKTEWEKTRWSAYITALSMGVKLKKPSDLIKFDWEREQGPNYSKDEIKNIQAEMYEAFINNKTGSISELIPK
jgi:hypothetical protein